MTQAEHRLNVPYIKLKFFIDFPNGAVLPEHKVSALRGTMGESLLGQFCVRDKNCASCLFEKTCIVQMTIYTQMERKPAFMQGSNDSVGYLLEYEDRRIQFAPEDESFFFLTLFGRNIEYFSLYLNALYQAGQMGIGKECQQFRILQIETQEHVILLDGNQVDMRNLRIRTLNDYVQKRYSRLQDAHRNLKTPDVYRVTFHTPLCVKYEGKYIRQFSAEAILPAVFRRIMMLDYFTENYIDMPHPEQLPVSTAQRSFPAEVTRYSSTQDRKITLRGITGSICLKGVSEEMLKYLLAGELLHIGKNTSFGFGRYTIE